MPRSGTLVICTQNLDFSGANQVILNVVAGTMHEGNIVILSPLKGPFAAKFAVYGAAVRTGDLVPLLDAVRDVFCVICNTIMTVIEMSQRPHPVIWILHEWWDDAMIVENLAIRNLFGMNLNTVKEAMVKASRIVCVCEGQRKLYSPVAPSSVIYVGVPSPSTENGFVRCERNGSMTTFLCIGIVCPRKNQIWAVTLFKQLMKRVNNCRLLIVGARYTRSYEAQYVQEVKAAIADDPAIDLYDVTDDVDTFYDMADVLLFTSLNEVTPMVISEAMSHGIPCVSTNIAGIPEMLRHGQEGFLVDPNDDVAAVEYMHQLATSTDLRLKMGMAGRARFSEVFDLNVMVDRYRKLIFEVAPPAVLVDMDGTVVDWDAGFRAVWSGRSHIDRSLSYYMEQCVGPDHHHEAQLVYHRQGFFESLPEIAGAVQALREMVDAGLNVMLCTSPVLTSQHCVQEKLNWIRTHLGEDWLNRVIMCTDKTAVRGDVLVDDKPLDLLAPLGRHTAATWRQLVFLAPYNTRAPGPRLERWSDWRSMLLPLLYDSSAAVGVGVHGASPDTRVPQSCAVITDDSANVAKIVTEAQQVDLLIGAFKETLDGGDHQCLTLTDDSDSFLEDYLGVRGHVERDVQDKGLAEVKLCLSKLAMTRLRDIDHKGMALGAEDVMEVELCRKSYRSWRRNTARISSK